MSAAAATEVVRWHPPGQALPAPDANVLLDLGSHGVWPGWWSGHDWRIGGDRPEGAVTEIVAWAPMPVGLCGRVR